MMFPAVAWSTLGEYMSARTSFVFPRLTQYALVLRDFQPVNPWSISPDGERVAMVENDGMLLWMRVIRLKDMSEQRFAVGERDPGAERPRLDNTMEAILQPTEGRTVLKDFYRERGVFNRVNALYWKSNDRLVFKTYANNQLWAINADGSDLVELLRYGRADADLSHRIQFTYRTVEDLLPVDSEALLVTSSIMRLDRTSHSIGSGHRYDAYLVSAINGNASPIANGRMRGMELLVDHLGFLRGGEYLDEKTETIELHLWDEEAERAVPVSQRIGEAVAERWGLKCHALDPQADEIRIHGWAFDPNILYVVRPTSRGSSALYALDLTTLDGDATPEPLVESEQFDLSGGSLILDSWRQEVVGYRFEGVRETTVWFNAELVAVQEALDAALGKRLNRIESWDRARERFVFRTLSERDESGVGMFDRRGEAPRVSVLESITGENGTHAATTPVWVPAGERKILCYLTVPVGATPGVPLPTIVMIPDLMETRAKWRFDPLVQGLVAAGYAVVEVNPRGTQGFASKDGRPQGGELTKAVVEDVGTVAGWAVGVGLAAPQQVHVMGNGYGGYAALVSVIERPKLFAAVISTHAVVDLWDWLVERSHGMVDATPLTVLSFEQSMRPWRGEELVRKEVMRRNPSARAEEIRVPVLLLHGKENRMVQDHQPARLQQKLERNGIPCELQVIDDIAWGDWSPSELPTVLEHITTFLGQVDPR